ncbi:MAG TPA: peptidase, partial [Chloroflexaceae bacterium]|nr:peptidase [Chloroflexaceae bacterium]
PLPNVRNVVLVGGDEVIPFYRLPDLTEIANEAEYADYLRSISGNGIVGANTPLGAALRFRMLLTDAPYGAGRPYRFYGFPFFVPRLAVGRLVETPDELFGFLDYYSGRIGQAAFQIDATAFGEPDPPRRAFVSGYDFLRDQADRIGAILRDTGLTPAEVNFLNNDQWRRPELERAWFDGALDAEFPLPPGLISGEANIALSSVNAHFDHWQLIPAVNPSSTSAGNFPALRLLAPSYAGQFPELYFGGTLGYSVGCHSGYSVPASAVLSSPAYDPALYRADFPQAVNRHGGNWVGNTGYGYGTADGVDYSERLAVLYTQELARETLAFGEVEVGATIGEALVKAKQRYVRNAASLSAYDYKVVNVMTLYGLPYVRVLVSNPLAPPAEDPAPNRPNVPLETEAPKDPTSLGRLTRTITFTIRQQTADFKTIARTGSQYWDPDADDFTVEDEFDQLGSDVFGQQVRVFANNQVGAPVLPTFAYDIGARSKDGSGRLRVLDVVFLGGTYGNRGAFDPQITQVATETLESTPLISRSDEPSFAAGAGFWYPDKFFGFSSVGEGEAQRDQLTSYAAQFRADDSGVTGLLRPYSQMVFRVTYDDPSVSNPAADALDLDTQAPVIESVTVRAAGAELGVAQAGQAVIVVRASDGGPVAGGGPGAVNQGLAEVGAIFVRDGVRWQPVALTETRAGSGVYSSAPLPLKPGALRFIVRATDRAGNSSYYTAKGLFTPVRTVWLPMTVR